MDSTNKPIITIETVVDVPVQKALTIWTTPEHITKWNAASDDWHTPSAENDLRIGGKFSYRMEAKDGSFGFDFYGTYDDVIEHKKIAYTISDVRKVEILFDAQGNSTKITESFEAENVNPLEMQQRGWQAILDNYKKYAEQTAI